MRIFDTILDRFAHVRRSACGSCDAGYGAQATCEACDCKVIRMIPLSENYIPTDEEEVTNVYLDDEIIARFVVLRPGEWSSEARR